MLVIRLARTGRAKYPTYRIVAAESARAATGKFVAILGHYNPHTKELVINHEETSKRLSQGAQPSETVVKLLQRDKVELPAWVKVQTHKPKAAAKDAPKAEAAETKDESKTEDVAPALQNPDERVAEVNEAAASDAEADATNIDGTDTAESEAKLASAEPKK